MNYLYRTYASNNPAGIHINLGFYALMEAICTKRTACEVLNSWCGLRENFDTEVKHRKKRCYTGCDGRKTEAIIKAYVEDKSRTRGEIARLADCSGAMVSNVLKRFGATKKNRWDGHVKKGK